jgi:hypothetical protein
LLDGEVTDFGTAKIPSTPLPPWTTKLPPPLKTKSTNKRLTISQFVMMKLPHLKKLGRKMLVTLPCCLLIRIILKLSMTMVSIFPYFPAREWLILIFFKH